MEAEEQRCVDEHELALLRNKITFMTTSAGNPRNPLEDSQCCTASLLMSLTKILSLPSARQFLGSSDCTELDVSSLFGALASLIVHYDVKALDKEQVECITNTLLRITRHATQQ